MNTISSNKIFGTLLITHILKFYGDKRESDELMIRLSKKTWSLWTLYGWGLYRECIYTNNLTKTDVSLICANFYENILRSKSLEVTGCIVQFLEHLWIDYERRKFILIGEISEAQSNKIMSLEELLKHKWMVDGKCFITKGTSLWYIQIINEKPIISKTNECNPGDKMRLPNNYVVPLIDYVKFNIIWYMYVYYIRWYITINCLCQRNQKPSYQKTNLFPMMKPPCMCELIPKKWY